jgi:hypothetical protein
MSWQAWHDHRDEIDPAGVAAFRHGASAAVMLAAAYAAAEALGFAESPAGRAVVGTAGMRFVVMVMLGVATAGLLLYGLSHAMVCGQICLGAASSRFRR